METVPERARKEPGVFSAKVVEWGAIPRGYLNCKWGKM